MHKEMADRLKNAVRNVQNISSSSKLLNNTQFEVDLPTHLTYGQGPVGSPRLLRALACFLNSFFRPIEPVVEQELLVASGVASLIDSLTWCICDDYEGILVPQPLYVGFKLDIPMRSRGKLLPVSFVESDREYSIHQVFDPESNRRAFERAFEQYTDEGVKIRAVLISKYDNLRHPLDPDC